MAQNIINYGASANDGQGDPLRTAFIKTDDNFNQIWNAGPVGSNISIGNNTVSVNNVNGNLILKPNGIGVIQVRNHVQPWLTNTYDLGAANLKFRNVYSNAVFANAMTMTGDVTIGGNLTVEGDTIQLGNITTDTLTVQLANSASNTAQANGAGVTVGLNDNIATILYNSTSNVWATNIGISAVGNITAPYFIGNGALLTGIVTSSYANANVVAYGQAGWAGNIIPSGNALYSLGNATNQWNDLYVSNATIYMNNVPISLTAGNVLTVAGADVVTTTANGVTALGNIGFVGDAIYDLNGMIIENADLTHGATAAVILPANGDGNAIQVNNIYGNIVLQAGTSGNITGSWTFGNDGNLEIPSGGYVRAGGALGIRSDFNDLSVTANAGSVSLTSVDNTFRLNQDGSIDFPDGTIVDSNIEGTGNFGFEMPANIGFGILTSAGSQEWAFGADGNLMLPGNAGADNASISSIENGLIVKLNSQANGYVGMTGFGSAGNNVAAITAVGLDGETDRVIISVYNPEIDDGEAWTFNNAGDFTTAGGNIFFGTQADDAVIVPGGTGVKIAADRGDITAGYVNVTSNGITIDALGSSTSDITIRAGDDVTIRGGDKVSAPQQRGGDITIAPGTGGDDGGAGAGNGGYVEIVGGDGGLGVNDSAGDGGDVTLVGGYGGTGNIDNAIVAGDGGMVILIGGTGGNNLDDLTLNGPGGNVEIYGGQGSIDVANNRPGGPAGHVFLRGGNWGFNFVETGNVHIETYNGNDFLNWEFDNQGRTYFPGLSTARGDTTSGTLSGFTLRIGDGSNEAIITTPDGDANTNSDSQRIVINPGKGADLTSGEGGDIYLWAGRGGSGDQANAVSAGSGGDIKIRGGQGGGVNGDGGYIRMEAGDGATGSEGDSGAAGYIEITGGSSGVGRNGGYVRILGGQGDVSGGDANLVGGYGASGLGGTVNIIGGTSGNGLSDYGNVNITSGASTWVFDNTGNLTVPNIIQGSSDSGYALKLGAFPEETAAGRWLQVRSGDVADHIHFDTSNNSAWNFYVGSDNQYVLLGNTGNVSIGSYDSNNVATYPWLFDNTGQLTVPPISTGGEGEQENARVRGTRKIVGETGTWSTYIDGHSTFGSVAWTASSSAIQSAKITFVINTNGTAFNWEQFDVSVCKLDGANAIVSVSGRIKQNSAIADTEVSAYDGEGGLEVWLNPADGQTVAYVNYDAVEFNIMAD